MTSTAAATDPATPPAANKTTGDLSPNAMADAALAEAMQERDASTKVHADEDGAESPSKRRKTDDADGDDEDDEVKEKIRDIWKDVKSEAEREKAFSMTMGIVSLEVDKLIRAGLDAFHHWENAAREVKLVKEELKNKDLELERLRDASEKSRETIANLLGLSEASKMEARETCRVARAEASLRADLSVMTTKRDEAVSEAEEAKRKAVLMEEELRHVKNKLARVTQEKIKMERDQRATLCLAKSLDTQTSADTDYYKRKVGDLTAQVQGLHAANAEKNRQLDEMRRQLERNMSQNRLATIRKEQAAGHQRSL